MLQPFQFNPGNENHDKEIKNNHVLATEIISFLLLIRIGNMDCCKCGYCKNEAREINCLWQTIWKALKSLGLPTKKNFTIK